MVHLCARPPKGSRQCVLGRETAIQKMVWNKEGWLRLACGGRFGQRETEEPEGIAEYIFPEEERKDYGRDEFDALPESDRVKTSALLDVRYTSLRQPYDSYASLTQRPGYLRLYDQESLNSCCNVSMIARRQQARHVQVETSIDFVPTCREQMAGLAYMYDTGNFYLLVKTRDEEYGCPSLDLKIPAKLRLIRSSHFAVDDVIPPIAIPENGPLFLRTVTTEDGLHAKFYYSLDGQNFRELAEVPTNILTDEQSEGFTGAHFGMYCHDMTGGRKWADFDYFEILRK